MIGDRCIYRIDGTGEFGAWGQRVWCHHCCGLHTAELLDFAWDEKKIRCDLKRLKESGLEKEMVGFISAAADANSTDFPVFMNNLLEKKILESEAKLHWLQNRKSPPRCWTCGVSDFEELNTIAEDLEGLFQHPNCGGYFSKVGGHGNAMQGIQGTFKVLDLNGNRIGERRN